ncbi:WCX domain-containing protein [Alkaliphilus crotonatoxidans]
MSGPLNKGEYALAVQDNGLFFMCDRLNRGSIPEEKKKLENYFSQEQWVVTLLLDPSLEYKIVESYGVNSYEIMPDQRIRFKLYYRNKDYALKTILGFGDKAEVISPKEMINEIRSCAKKIYEKYY